MKKIAIIDLGSNSVRMSIFSVPDYKTYTLLNNHRIMVKLSEGMGESCMLTSAAQERVLTALSNYCAIIKEECVNEIKAVATAAVRKAKNGIEFLNLVKEKTGIEVEVIAGEKEAYLDFLAVKEILNIKSGIICDIGGGSVELINVSSNLSPLECVSIPIGSRAIYERFFAHGETISAYSEAEAWISSLFSDVKWLSNVKDVPIIGLGGTLRALAKYDCNDKTQQLIESHKISSNRIDFLFNRILNSSIDERKDMAGIGKDRADIMVGGLISLMCLKKMINSPQLIVADIGVREGLLMEFLQKMYRN